MPLIIINKDSFLIPTAIHTLEQVRSGREVELHVVEVEGLS